MHMDFETLCVKEPGRPYERTGAVAVPIYQTATFAHPGVGESTGYDYTRSQNPTRESLEGALAALEGGAGAVAFASGMAAITCFMELFAPGDHIVCTTDLYGGTRRLFDQVSKKNGLRFSLASTAQEIEAAAGRNTKAVLVETPSNPLMQVTDIAEVAAMTRARGILLCVDNTFLTPCFQRPLALGADVVAHSGTKYLGGHNDTLAGALVCADGALLERLRFLAKTTGSCLSPFDSFLVLRGVKTLALRMARQQDNAMKVADWLLMQDGVVEEVLYPGLPRHPQYAVSCRQASGHGAMISFRTRTEGAARAILSRVRLIRYAESLGGAESLITYPMLQTHADLPEAERAARGIDGRLLRLSVGIESARDLIADLAQAMEGADAGAGGAGADAGAGEGADAGAGGGAGGGIGYVGGGDDAHGEPGGNP
jgi:cystathionine beta-lyase/cystathionine gamma-synthase